MTAGAARKRMTPDPCSVAAVIGAAILLAGVWRLSHACALIVAGLLILCASVLVAAGRERQKKMESAG